MPGNIKMRTHMHMTVYRVMPPRMPGTITVIFQRKEVSNMHARTKWRVRICIWLYIESCHHACLEQQKSTFFSNIHTKNKCVIPAEAVPTRMFENLRLNLWRLNLWPKTQSSCVWVSHAYSNSSFARHSPCLCEILKYAYIVMYTYSNSSFTQHSRCLCEILITVCTHNIRCMYVYIHTYAWPWT